MRPRAQGDDSGTWKEGNTPLGLKEVPETLVAWNSKGSGTISLNMFRFILLKISEPPVETVSCKIVHCTGIHSLRIWYLVASRINLMTCSSLKYIVPVGFRSWL